MAQTVLEKLKTIMSNILSSDKVEERQVAPSHPEKESQPAPIMDEKHVNKTLEITQKMYQIEKEREKSEKTSKGKK